MRIKKNKSDSRKPLRTRRTFLKSTGLFITGIGLIRPSFLFGNYVRLSERNPLAVKVENDGIVQDAVRLPDGVKAVWDLSKAYHETTATTERICINGLWQWQPGELHSDELPIANWGYFKVPGQWPRTPDMRDGNQRHYAHPSWNDISLENVTTAWYQRDLIVPESWAGRRIILMTEYLNSNTRVYIDGQKAGELWFPGGELDLTSFCTPGKRHLLSMKVTAVPLKDVITAYSDSLMPRQVEATVVRRGTLWRRISHRQTLRFVHCQPEH